jgi:UDP-N-acetylmuramate dehydrogenase
VSEASGMIDELRARVRGRVLVDAPLAAYTTFRVGGPADVLVEAEAEDDLVAVAEVVRATFPTTVVGRGSNLLVSDDGFRGVAIRLGRSFRVHVQTREGFRFGGAVYLPAAAKLSARAGLTGMEFAAEIPATFGGAVRMNAGAHGRAIADVLVWASGTDLSSGERLRWEVDELGYSYRRSALPPQVVVTQGEVRLQPDDPADVGARITEYLRWRRENQPGGRSAGSVFKNPDGDSAGRLIDAAGGKGMREGGAEVSDVHANFIVAERDATATDVWRLLWRIRALVHDRTGVELEPEVRFLGAFPQVEGAGEG